MSEDIFVAHRSAWRAVLGVAICAAGIAFFAWIAIDPEPWQNALARPAGFFGVLVFAFALAMALRGPRDGGAEITVSAEGLHWRPWSDETIPWTAFRTAGARRRGSERALSLWLVDPAAAPRRTFLSRASRLTTRLGGADIDLTTTGTDRRFSDLVEAVQRHAPHLFRDRPGRPTR